MKVYSWHKEDNYVVEGEHGSDKVFEKIIKHSDHLDAVKELTEENKGWEELAAKKDGAFTAESAKWLIENQHLKDKLAKAEEYLKDEHQAKNKHFGEVLRLRNLLEQEQQENEEWKAIIESQNRLIKQLKGG